MKNDIVTFTPPPGWKMAEDISSRFPKVKVMVVGQTESGYPPNINLSMESYNGTLKDYLKKVKEYEESQGNEWKDLGSIKAEAGSGSLSQFDTKTKWGNTRYMRLIFIKNGTIYLLTASALANEFSKYYKDFFASMRSLRIIKNPYELIPAAKQREELKKSIDTLIGQWNEALKEQKNAPSLEDKQAVFESDTFQKDYWMPFLQTIETKYTALGSDWKLLLIDTVKEEMFFENTNQTINKKTEE